MNVPYYRFQSRLETGGQWTTEEVEELFKEMANLGMQNDCLRKACQEAEKVLGMMMYQPTKLHWQDIDAAKLLTHNALFDTTPYLPEVDDAEPWFTVPDSFPLNEVPVIVHGSELLVDSVAVFNGDFINPRWLGRGEDRTDVTHYHYLPKGPKK